MKTADILLWINRIAYLLFSALIAGDIFTNRYGSDDYDVETGYNFVLIFIVMLFSLFELICQIIRRKVSWFQVLLIIGLAHVTSFVTMACMETYYHRLPICSRYSACARQSGSPYDESNLPPLPKKSPSTHSK